MGGRGAIGAEGVGRGPLSTGGEVWGEDCAPSLEKKFPFLISNRQILVQTGCFLYSSPKAGLNAVPTVKITLGMRRSRWK